MSATDGTLEVGCRVLIQRDEARWPSRGSWPQYRGRTGTVVALPTGTSPEVGVTFRAGLPAEPAEVARLLRAGGLPTSWFLPRELTAL